MIKRIVKLEFKKNKTKIFKEIFKDNYMKILSHEGCEKLELLEDINLKDARGVLVNISAKDPTMGDFTEVSEVVEEFTADDATCIYGLVIDPSLKDELMVTIVATGVNQKSPKLAIDSKPRASIKLSPVGLDKDLTNKEVQQVGASSAEAIDFLDVPTFMRKQVD